MSSKIRVAWVALLFCGVARANAAPVVAAKLDVPTTVRSGQSVKIGALVVGVTARHRPLERGPQGRELFPSTDYTLTWKEGSDKATIANLTASSRGAQVIPYRALDRYTFVLERGRDLDEVVLTIRKRTCLRSYTYSNQLQHADGKIIFTEQEDLCCAWSDDEDRCDPAVTRASGAGSTPRYCVIYSLVSGSQESGKACCCQFERGEKIEAKCEAHCAKKTK